MNDFSSKHFLSGTYWIVIDPKSGQLEKGQIAVNSGEEMLTQCSPGPCSWNSKDNNGASSANSLRISEAERSLKSFPSSYCLKVVIICMLLSLLFLLL